MQNIILTSSVAAILPFIQTKIANLVANSVLYGQIDVPIGKLVEDMSFLVKMK